MILELSLDFGYYGNSFVLFLGMFVLSAVICLSIKIKDFLAILMLTSILTIFLSIVSDSSEFLFAIGIMLAIVSIMLAFRIKFNLFGNGSDME